MRSVPTSSIGFAQKGGRFQADQLRSAWFVLLREISCNFVDRLLRIRSHTIHEITLNSTKEHEIRVFVQSLFKPLQQFGINFIRQS